MISNGTVVKKWKGGKAEEMGKWKLAKRFRLRTTKHQVHIFTVPLSISAKRPDLIAPFSLLVINNFQLL